MVYLAAGISGLTGIAGTFFVKDYLDLPAEFLAMLGFWVGLPWAFKMPLGHLVDLIWKWKSLLVFLGATLIAASLTIMLILIHSPSLLYTSMSMESWFVLAAMLALLRPSELLPTRIAPQKARLWSTKTTQTVSRASPATISATRSWASSRRTILTKSEIGHQTAPTHKGMTIKRTTGKNHI